MKRTFAIDLENGTSLYAVSLANDQFVYGDADAIENFNDYLSFIGNIVSDTQFVHMHLLMNDIKSVRVEDIVSIAMIDVNDDSTFSTVKYDK